jgi:O-acetylhomoserine (thiol)-lyase
MKIETIAVHGGYSPDPTTKAVAVPIYQTTSYAFDDTQHGADLFDLKVAGNIYTRIMNPTTDVLEKRMAELEGGIAALGVASGMAAITYAIQTIAEAGDNIVSVGTLYGGTYNLFAHTLPQYGIEVRFADYRNPESFRPLIDGRTKALFCESIGNPLGNVVDLAALAKIAHDAGVPLIVDNTVPTPYLCRPFEHGADIVVHALTKYLGGHGNSIGGVIVDSGKFPWAEHKERFKRLNTPDVSYHGVVYTEALGPAAYIGRCRVVPLRNTGAAISPFNSFLILQGIETLALRMDRICKNTLAVANYLKTHRQGGLGELCRPARPCRPCADPEIHGWPRLGHPVLRRETRGRGRRALPGCIEAGDAPGQHRRCQEPGLPSGVDHASAIVGRRDEEGRRFRRHGAPVDRHRAHRRHQGRPGAGAGGGVGRGSTAWPAPSCFPRHRFSAAAIPPPAFPVVPTLRPAASPTRAPQVRRRSPPDRHRRPAWFRARRQCCRARPSGRG